MKKGERGEQNEDGSGVCVRARVRAGACSMFKIDVTSLILMVSPQPITM